MVASSSARIGIRCDMCSLAARASTGVWRRYWMRLPGGSRMAGSRGSGSGRGWRVRATAKWATHLSVAWGPMEIQGALVDGTVRSEVSQVMTLEACIGVFRVRRQQQHNRDMDDDGSSNNNNNNNVYLCQMAQAAQTTMMTTRTACACATH